MILVVDLPRSFTKRAFVVRGCGHRRVTVQDMAVSLAWCRVVSWFLIQRVGRDALCSDAQRGAEHGEPRDDCGDVGAPGPGVCDPHV